MSRRMRVLRGVAITCIAAIVLSMAAWSWMAFRPTGLTAEVARIEAKYAELTRKGRRLPAITPPPNAEPESVEYPGDEPVTELTNEQVGLNLEIMKLLSQDSTAMALVSQVMPQVAMVNGSVALPSQGLLWEHSGELPPDLLEPLHDKMTGNSDSIDVETIQHPQLKTLLSLVERSHELDLRIIEILPGTPDSVPSRFMISAPSPFRLLASFPRHDGSSPRSAADQLETLLSDDVGRNSAECNVDRIGHGHGIGRGGWRRYSLLKEPADAGGRARSCYRVPS